MTDTDQSKIANAIDTHIMHTLLKKKGWAKIGERSGVTKWSEISPQKFNAWPDDRSLVIEIENGHITIRERTLHCSEVLEKVPVPPRYKLLKKYMLEHFPEVTRVPTIKEVSLPESEASTCIVFETKENTFVVTGSDEKVHHITLSQAAVYALACQPTFELTPA